MTMKGDSRRDQETKIDAVKLRELTEFFSIGKGLRYSPDEQLVVVFDTIIVAYCVNGHFIYARSGIKTDSNGNPSAVVFGEEKSELPVEQLEQLQLLVPDTSDMEGSLDYDRRAIIGREQQFLEGHVITLMANAGARGAATLITKVAKQVILQEGPYANSKMILLNPELATLTVNDQFHKTRGKTHVPVDLYFKKDEPPYGCVLNDFSETSLGLRTKDNQQTMPPLTQDDSVTIVINLGEGAKTYTIKGRIFRSSPNSCVIRLEELFKGHEFSRFSQLDALELKTGLLNYGD